MVKDKLRHIKTFKSLFEQEWGITKCKVVRSTLARGIWGQTYKEATQENGLTLA